MILQENTNVVGPVSNATIRLTDDTNYFGVIANEDYTEITTFGTYGVGSGNLNYPYAAAVTPSGAEIWVCDGSNHRIARFQLDGTWVGSFGSYGTGNGNLNTPTGIVFDASGNAYVTDFGNNRVQKFNSSGTYQAKWATASGPNSIAIDPITGYLWVACSTPATGSVVAYNTSGVQQVTLGTIGYKTYSVAVDSKGKAVMVGTEVGGILRFTPAGLYSGVLFSGELTSGNPLYVVADQSQVLYIFDPVLDRIWKGLKSGESLYMIGISGTSGEMAFRKPRHVARYLEHIFIVDTENHKIHKCTSGSKSNAIVFKIDYQGNIQHTGYLERM